MLRTLVSTWIISCSFLFSSNISAATLNIAVLYATQKESNAYSAQVAKFEKAFPNIDVKLHPFSDTEYKQNLSSWLSVGGMDVLYWQAGNRLFQYVKSKKLEPLDDVWKRALLNEVYATGIRDLVTFDDKIFGIPYTYYHWGFFYNRKLFQQYEITQPQTVEELYTICQTLSENGHTPVVIGNKYKWPVLAWFDYFNLRINGLEFHQNVAAGNISFKSERIVNVLQSWKSFMEVCPFNSDFNEVDWHEPVKMMLNNDAAMMLVGNFMQQQIPEAQIKDITFFPFPTIDPQIPAYEEAPTELWMMPKTAKNKKAAKTFLQFVTRPDIQSDFNDTLGYLAPHKHAISSGNHLTILGERLLKTAPGYSQFFDRDAPDHLVRAAMDAFYQFLQDKDSDKVIKTLEQARVNKFYKSN